MKNNGKLPLPLINYNDPEFSVHVFKSLKKYGACVLQHISKISPEADRLFSEFNTLSAQPQPEIAGSGILDLVGFHPYSQHWAGRRFSECYGFISNDKGLIKQSFPTENFQDAAVSFLGIAREVTGKVLSAINNNISIEQYLNNYSILGIVDSYVIPTQEKIKVLHACGQLTLTEDENLEAFEPHCDVNALTLIVYANNNCSGLEIELPNETGNLAYQSVSLPEQKDNQLMMLILVGSTIQILTHNELRAPKHRVVLEPVQSKEKFERKLVSAFTLFGSKNQASTSPNESFNQVEHIENQYKLLKKEYKSHTVLPVNFLARFPRENELEKLKLEEAIVCQRI